MKGVKMIQLKRLERLLTRKRGCTSAEICDTLPSVTPHRRLSDLKKRGWTITHQQDGRLKRYFGKPPEKLV
jgi:hypothetical protein